MARPERARPSHRALPRATEQSHLPCGLLRRLGIIVYDVVIVIALLMLAAMAAMLAGFRGQTAFRDPGYTLYLGAVWCSYIVGCWHAGGMTLGMRAWRIRIEERALADRRG